MIGYIYITTNQITGKKYVGRKSSQQFLETKYLGSGIHLKNAIKKYGKENFTVELLQECNTPEELYNAEKSWISKFDAMNSSMFYNHSPGGKEDGFLVGEENIAKRVENRKRHSEFMKSFRHTEETKQKMSQARKGYKHSEDTKSKISISNTGKRLGMRASDSTRQKMSQSHKGKVLSEETRKKISIQNKGKRLGATSSPETVEKLKAAQADRVWITDGDSSKKIKREDVQSYILLGWKYGRAHKNE